MHTNKRGLGDSIEHRPKSVDDRQEFGHWEADTVVGSKAEKEPCVATLVERKTRDCIWVKAENHTAEAVQAAIDSVIASFGEKASLVFKTVTADNGSEFAKLTELVPLKQIQEWLGHSDFSTTANIYAHLDATAKQQTAEAMFHGLGLDEPQDSNPNKNSAKRQAQDMSFCRIKCGELGI